MLKELLYKYSAVHFPFFLVMWHKKTGSADVAAPVHF